MRFSRVLSEVRVRFAPSPTGNLHIGGLRTAFFNYLFAKKFNGSFVLRIEDTDRTRFVEEAQNKIYKALETFGLTPDEGPKEGGSYGPYEQSKRLPFYHEAVENLIENRKAYRCFCSEQRLNLLRKDSTRRGEIPKYDRKCENLDAETSKAMAKAGEQFVVRFKLDKQNIFFKDEIFGEITQHLDESDPILLKSDGFPTYHLANVVDDQKMKISHVIRGMEWLSSTGKHHALYRAFNWQPPKYLHLSLIMRTATQKLSKRDKDAFAEYYLEELGVLPSAVLNLLIRNGSGIQNFDLKHFYSLEEIIKQFDPSLLGKRNLLLDTNILEKYSRLAFQNSDFDSDIYPRLVQNIIDDLKIDVAEIPSKKYLRKVVEFLRSKEESFGNLKQLTKGEFVWMLTRPKTAELLISTSDGIDVRNILGDLKKIESWKIENIQQLASKHSISKSKIMGIIRISLIGSKKGPPISELIEFFEEEECRHRISVMYDLFSKQESTSNDFLSQL